MAAAVQSKLPAEVADVGFKQAMQQKWLSMDKSGGAPRIVRKVSLQSTQETQTPICLAVSLLSVGVRLESALALVYCAVSGQSTRSKFTN